jgi:hypothetical protein
MISVRKSLVLVHRYLGIVLSLFFVMWFATGIGMIYSRGMPRLTPEVRLSRLSAVDFTRVRLSPVEAAERAYVEQPGRAVLLSVQGRPAYRFSNSETVFADNGDVFEGLDLAQAKTLAAEFARVSEDKIRNVAEIDAPDQWTLTQGRQLRGAHRALCLTAARRGGSTHDSRQQSAGVGFHYSAFLLLRASTGEDAALVSIGHLDCWSRMRTVAGGHRHRIDGIQTVAHPLFRLDAMALRHRTRVRSSDIDVGLQRTAFDGAVGVDRA